MAVERLPEHQTEITKHAGSEVLETSAPEQVPDNAATCGDAVTRLSRTPAESDQFGESGAGADAVCRCGAGPHDELPDRCAAGHVIVGNGLALLTGSRSAAFRDAPANAQKEIERAVLADRGHGIDDAPRALQLAVEGIAQAVLVRDSAFQRMKEAGGPLSSSGRERRAFQVWTAALDRLERHLRLVGIDRRRKRWPI